MQMMNSDQPTPEKCLVIRPLSYVLELCGWAQARAARKEKLGALHVTFLKRAVWDCDGRVSFDRIHHETGIPRYAVARAAAKLEKRGFGKVKPDEKDKPWKRLHISLRGLKCWERIESATVRGLMTQLRLSELTSYYNFASHIHKAAQRLPDSSAVLGKWTFPNEITYGSGWNEQQKRLIRFLEDIQTGRI